ncbi:hypothetical protein V8E52_007879 [Russula decolorans]|jgi:polyadenylate-binding protein
MHGLNGLLLGSKQLVVRSHKPKQLHQEKLAPRFAGQNGHPCRASGATSPTPNEGSPVSHSERLAVTEMTPKGSGSYYNVALAGMLNLPMRYDDLSALSPVVHKEVLRGELSRHLNHMPTIPSADPTADEFLALSSGSAFSRTTQSSPEFT